MRIAIILLGFVSVCLLALIPYWVIGSAVTSGVKSVSDDCGKTYPVPLVSQDWFCAD